MISICVVEGQRDVAPLDETPVLNYALVMLAYEQPTLQQIAVWRAMSGEERLHLAEQLYRMARKLKAAGVQSQHPDWPLERVEAEVSKIFVNART